MKSFHHHWAVHVQVRTFATLYLCKKCKISRPLTKFYKHSQCKSGYDLSSCKLCIYQRKCTTDGFLQNLMSNAKYREIRRYNKKQQDAPAFCLSMDIMHNLFDKQDKRGYYSHLPLALRPLSDWQASLERKDPSKDYTIDNVALEALEFNTSCQWSIEKILKVPFLIHEPSTITFEQLDTVHIKPQRALAHRRKIQDNCCYCNICHQWKDITDFYKSTLTRCKKCHVKESLKKRESLRGFLMHLLRNCNGGSKTKWDISGGTRNTFALSMDDLIEILKLQNLRCKYSGIPMTFKPNSDWMCSIERIDNNKGYTKDNIALICWEFQSVDNSIRSENPVYGSAQMSREKFEYFYETRFGVEPPPQTEYGKSLWLKSLHKNHSA